MKKYLKSSSERLLTPFALNTSGLRIFPEFRIIAGLKQNCSENFSIKFSKENNFEKVIN